MQRFQARTALSSRSMARRSGFCGLKPSAPRISQILVSPNLTPYLRWMSAPTRLSVHSLVSKPYALGLFSSARANSSSCQACSLRGPPRRGHDPQRVNAAFIENFSLDVHRLPGHAHRGCNLGRVFAFCSSGPARTHCLDTSFSLFFGV